MDLFFFFFLVVSFLSFLVVWHRFLVPSLSTYRHGLGFDDVAVLMTVSPRRTPSPPASPTWFWIDRADDRACRPWSVLQADRDKLDYYLVYPESLAVDGKYTLGIFGVLRVGFLS